MKPFLYGKQVKQDTVNGNGARMYTITHAQLNSTKIATTNIIRSSREGTFAYAYTSHQTRLHSHSFLRVWFLKVSKIRREFSDACVPSRIDGNWLKCTQKLWDWDAIALEHIGFTKNSKFLSIRVKFLSV